MCVLMFKTSHHPKGKIADVLARLTLGQLRTLLGQLQYVRATETLQFPIAPM